MGLNPTLERNHGLFITGKIIRSVCATTVSVQGIFLASAHSARRRKQTNALSAIMLLLPKIAIRMVTVIL